MSSVGECLGQLLLAAMPLLSYIRRCCIVFEMLTSKSGSRDGITIKERLKHTLASNLYGVLCQPYSAVLYSLSRRPPPN